LIVDLLSDHGVTVSASSLKALLWPSRGYVACMRKSAKVRRTKRRIGLGAGGQTGQAGGERSGEVAGANGVTFRGFVASPAQTPSPQEGSHESVRKVIPDARSPFTPREDLEEI
jgi:hypothetical protein